MKIKLLLFYFFFTITSAYSQQGEEEAYNREFNYGVNFNTRGHLIGGIMVKSSRYMKGNWSQFYALEVVDIKHPKEKREFSEVTGNSYIYGKSNYLFVIRPQYGRDYVFFRKAPESGVQVNGILAAGPSIGLLVPYFIVYDYTQPGGGQNTPTDYRSEQFDPDKHEQYGKERIRGSAGVLSGFPSTNFNIGAHFKSGLSFEYGRYREDVTGVEVGFLLEAYPKKLVMIPRATNVNFFSSVYLTLYYGRRK